MEIFSSYTGADFLAFFGVMLLTCFAAGYVIPASLREQGRHGDVRDYGEAAVLTGGVERFVSAVLTQLFAHGALEPGSGRKLRVAREGIEASPPERAVLRKVGEFRARDAKDTLAEDAGRVEEALIRRGLLLDRGDRTRLRIASALPFAVLFAIGLYRQQAGDALGEPTGFLIVLLGITAIFGIFRFARLNPRTVEGNKALTRLQEQSSRMRRAPAAGEAGMAVAIFGTAVLVGTPWEPVHAMRQQGDGGSGGDGGGSDGDGGGGGCGGGCGGCGG